MNIIPEEIMDKLVNILNFRDTNFEKLIDATLKNYLTYSRVLESQKPKILEIINTFNMEDLYYNQYYWFVKFKNKYFELHGYDEGIEQQAFKILENIDIQLNNGIDWKIIEYIDNEIIFYQ